MTEQNAGDIYERIKAAVPEGVSFICILYPGGGSTTDGDIISRDVSADQMQLSAQSLLGLYTFTRQKEIEEAMRHSIATPGGQVVPGGRKRRMH